MVGSERNMPEKFAPEQGKLFRLYYKHILNDSAQKNLRFRKKYVPNPTISVQKKTPESSDVLYFKRLFDDDPDFQVA